MNAVASSAVAYQQRRAPADSRPRHMRVPLGGLPLQYLPIEFSQDGLEPGAFVDRENAEKKAGHLGDVRFHRNVRRRATGADAVRLSPPVAGILHLFDKPHVVQRCKGPTDVHGVHAHELGQIVSSRFAFTRKCNQDAQLIWAEAGGSATLSRIGRLISDENFNIATSRPMSPLFLSSRLRVMWSPTLSV